MRTLYAQSSNQRLKEVILDLSKDVESGLSLSQAVQRFPLVFSEFYVNMIRSAEVTGRMDEVMIFLADYLEKEYGLLVRVRNALIYPVIVVILFILVSGLMVTLVVPSIAPIFEEAKIELPIFTKILLASSAFIINYWWVLLILFAGLLLFFLDYVKTNEGKAITNEMLMKIPVLGNLLQKMYLARMSESISVLIQGGIPLTQSVEISSHTVGSIVYRDMLHVVSQEIQAGQLMSQVFLRYDKYFPAIVTQMVAVGESTGRLEEMLKKVSKFYTTEVDSLISNLVELIQPILMVGIGIMVALLFAAILLPLYDLVNAI